MIWFGTNLCLHNLKLRIILFRLFIGMVCIYEFLMFVKSHVEDTVDKQRV